ncbi:MAG: pilus assembly protein PilP [Nitrospinae bacterium]|nr:pilus assembly protein PilP [Nitrospinota bacterium]MBF0633630.1 pilus assembly protein PilP [Nitrospinota bacterium]
MKPRIVIVLCVVAMVAYTVYNNFVRVAPSEDLNVRNSFQAMSMGISLGNIEAVKAFISPTFSDSKINKDDFLKVLGLKRKMYSARVSNVTVQDDIALVSYSRAEVRGDDSEPINVNITGETWIKNKARPGIWSLQKLADGDTWFRTAEIPQKKVVVAVTQKKEGSVLGTLEKGTGVKAMKKGERYNSTGKRDPFKPLIAIGVSDTETLADEICESSRPREELEKYDLDALKLAGIIQSDKGPMALIETPDGKGYTVYMNMFLGKRCGKVSEMQGDYILLKEKVRKPSDKPGQFTTIDTPMQLRREEG